MIPIRSAVGWLWKWSGCPVILLAGPLLLYGQAAHLDMSVDEQRSMFGARQAWRLMTYSPGTFWGNGATIQSILFVYIERGDEIEARSYQNGELGSVPCVAIDGDLARFRGIWAPTSRGVLFEQQTMFLEPGILGGNVFPSKNYKPVLSEAHYLRALRATAPIYRDTMPDHDPLVYRAMLSGRLDYSEPIYAGYAHNGAVLLILGMMLRGVFGIRRWVVAARRWARSRRGHCAGCGYDLDGLTGGRCPECGVAAVVQDTAVSGEQIRA